MCNRDVKSSSVLFWQDLFHRLLQGSLVSLLMVFSWISETVTRIITIERPYRISNIPIEIEYRIGGLIASLNMPIFGIMDPNSSLSKFFDTCSCSSENIPIRSKNNIKVFVGHYMCYFLNDSCPKSTFCHIYLKMRSKKHEIVCFCRLAAFKV